MGKKSRGKRTRHSARKSMETAVSAGLGGSTDCAAHRGAEPLRAPRPRATGAAEDGYLADCDQAQALINAGQIERAKAIFNQVLAQLGDGPSFTRAVILGRLGTCFCLEGQPELALRQLDAATKVVGRLPPSAATEGLLGILHSDRGDVYRATGQHRPAREAYLAGLAVAEQLQDRRAQAVDLDRLGSLALVEGKLEAALAHYRAALDIIKTLAEPALEAVARHRLGQVMQRMHDWQNAESLYRAAARISSQTQNFVQLQRDLRALVGLLQQQPARINEARSLAEEALLVTQSVDATAADVWQLYGMLADFAERQAAATSVDDEAAALRAQAQNYHQLCLHGPRICAALSGLDDAPSYGKAVLLGRLGQCFYLGQRPDLAVGRTREALAVLDQLPPSNGVSRLRSTLQSALGNGLRASGENPPAQAAFAAALSLAEEREDVHGQVVELSNLAALALSEGRLEDALKHCQDARLLAARFPDAVMEAFCCRQLAQAYQGLRNWDEAERCYRDAIAISEAYGDSTGAVQSRQLLTDLDRDAGRPQSGAAVSDAPTAIGEAGDQTFAVTLYEELTTEYVCEPDLLLDDRREQTATQWTQEAEPLSGDRRPLLVPGTRDYLDTRGAVRFCLPPAEPSLERHSDCVVIRRARRQVSVDGAADLLWRLIRLLDGANTVEKILTGFPASERGPAARLLATLTACGAIDVSGRPFGRFLHAATKKGVLPGGGLMSDEVLRLATDGDYREFPEAPRISVAESVPSRLRALHELTRARRSRRDYPATAIGRGDFDALLTTACGVTGSMQWQGRRVNLRAYPSSGALYAVEIYPVVLRVDGFEPGIYHYRAVGNQLELIRSGIDWDRLLGAMLPVERGMVAGGAALVCLAGSFSRHERKYGEGGYRMLVAEAGHISQNLVLAATALGLTARPFGGVFDDLLNADLGLDASGEQFLLSVLVGGQEGEGTMR